ncbi:MAG TPA: hypothetical protein VLJ39_07160 [Tepidisphaeraceae bacterium]|nr:hypothetical protein [Tepidisphaeraceae bacterium]
MRRTVSRLLAAMAGGLILTAGITALLIELAGRPGWWSGWVASMIVGTLAALLSLALVVPGFVAGLQWAVYGYLAGSVARVLTALGGCVVAVLIFRTPAAPTLFLIVPIYFAQVVIEAVVLSRAFWPRGRQ